MGGQRPLPPPSPVEREPERYGDSMTLPILCYFSAIVAEPQRRHSGGLSYPDAKVVRNTLGSPKFALYGNGIR